MAESAAVGRINNAATIGGFEQSFVFHMIRDFFLLLLLVAVAELTIRYLALRYDFATNEPARVESATQKLAGDIKAIMLNSGGPLAAQTVYPILNRNYEDLGLSIAVLPSTVTVESMRATFNMEVEGLMPQWPDGTYQQGLVTVQAEQFCLNCHVKAKVGDVLGIVAVRSYLARKEALWWQEVRLTAGALSLKILVHTIVLLLLLRVRMAPLLALRSTVSGLAKGVMDLSPRAQVRTHDEFGELAQDLNHFLDRIGQVVRDLDRILSEVVTVGQRLGSLNLGLEQQLDDLRKASLGEQQRIGQAQSAARQRAGHETGAFQALDASLTHTLNAIAAMASRPDAAAVSSATNEVMREQVGRLRQSFVAVTEALQQVVGAEPTGALAGDMPVQMQALAKSFHDMALLEATMQQVALSGQQVLQRLARGVVTQNSPDDLGR